jgi:hypothetical protein
MKGGLRHDRKHLSVSCNSVFPAALDKTHLSRSRTIEQLYAEATSRYMGKNEGRYESLPIALDEFVLYEGHIQFHLEV